MIINETALATILFALRLHQDQHLENGKEESFIEDMTGSGFFEDCTPMSANEIDDFAEMLNTIDSVSLTPTQYANLVFALRQHQARNLEVDGGGMFIASMNETDHFSGHAPMNNEEVDELIEWLTISDDDSSGEPQTNVKVLGYQVQNLQGDNFGGRFSYLILTEQTAISDLMAARSKDPSGCWNIVTILTDDIDEPIFENTLSGLGDNYRAIGVSVGHLTWSDRAMLSKLASPTTNLILERETGWLVMLNSDPSYIRKMEGFTELFYQTCETIHAAGYKLIEFDEAADTYPKELPYLFDC